MTEEERYLVEGCIREDRTIQRKVWDLYSIKAFHSCLEVASEKEDAEEGLMDGFVTVYDSIRKFKGQTSLEDWIKETCRTETENRLKYKKRK